MPTCSCMMNKLPSQDFLGDKINNFLEQHFSCVRTIWKSPDEWRWPNNLRVQVRALWRHGIPSHVRASSFTKLSNIRTWCLVNLIFMIKTNEFIINYNLFHQTLHASEGIPWTIFFGQDTSGDAQSGSQWEGFPGKSWRCWQNTVHLVRIRSYQHIRNDRRYGILLYNIHANRRHPRQKLSWFVMCRIAAEFIAGKTGSMTRYRVHVCPCWKIAHQVKIIM